MRISLIAAVARNGVIGRDGDLPWRLPADLAFFKRTTMGHHIVMGRRTRESLPARPDPLPGRTIVVLSRSATEAGGCAIVRTLDEAVAVAERAGESELFIGGGAEVYALALPVADRMYITEVAVDAEGDTSFPTFARESWIEVSRTAHDVDDRNPYPYAFVVLDRRR